MEDIFTMIGMIVVFALAGYGLIKLFGDKK